MFAWRTGAGDRKARVGPNGGEGRPRVSGCISGAVQCIKLQTVAPEFPLIFMDLRGSVYQCIIFRALPGSCGILSFSSAFFGKRKKSGVVVRVKESLTLLH